MKRPLSPPSRASLLKELAPDRLMAIATQHLAERDTRYLHWDELRHRDSPAGVSHEEWWLSLKLGRMVTARTIPLTDPGGRRFLYSQPDRLIELLHLMDSDARGQLGISSPVTTKETRDQFILRSLIEEAITSSQLEGASTTRRVAKTMLRSGRRPRDSSERMIWNNFQAMQQARELIDQKLTPELVCTLHRTACVDTLEDPGAAGRLQLESEERVAVIDQRDGTRLHEPPAARELPERILTMCRFANGELDEGRFLHPLIRAITLHFWLAYDHPFVDGNGRAARILFYWSALRAGYWLIEFLPISRIIRKAPAKYARSFLHTETDENDLTYFLLHQLEVLRRAVGDLQAYLDRKQRELRSLERKLKRDSSLNHRQRSLLSHALRHPGTVYTVESHRRSHAVAYATARQDLMALSENGLLQARKAGRRWEFVSSDDAREWIRADRPAAAP